MSVLVRMCVCVSALYVCSCLKRDISRGGRWKLNLGMREQLQWWRSRKHANQLL